MRALLRVRDQPESEDGNGDEPRQEERGRQRQVLRLRCYACAGSGRLELVDEQGRATRIVRCVACRGAGTVTVEW